MFDIGFTELLFVGIIALVVIGPERLPAAARTAGKWIGKAKQVATTIKHDIEHEIAAEELQAQIKAQTDGSTLSSIKQSLNMPEQELKKISAEIKNSILPEDDPAIGNLNLDVEPLPQEVTKDNSSSESIKNK